MKTIQTETIMYSKQDLLAAGVSKCDVQKISYKFRQAGGLDIGDCFNWHWLPKNVQKKLSLKPTQPPGIPANEKEWQMLADAVNIDIAIHADLVQESYWHWLPKNVQSKLPLKPTPPRDMPVNESEWKMLADAVSADLAIYADLVHENPTLAPDRIADILRAAGWMRLLAEGKKAKLGFKSKPELLRVAIMALQAENLSCLRISSPEWLRKRITQWKKLGWRSLVSGKLGMVKALKCTPEAEQVLKALFADPRRFSAYKVTRIYQLLRVTSHTSLPELSETTIRKIQLSQSEFTTSTIITTSEK